MKRFLFLLLIPIALFADMRTIQGTIIQDRLVESDGYRAYGVHLRVKANGQIWTILVGPVWWMNQQGYTFPEGAPIEVYGDVSDDWEMIAYTIDIEGEHIVLRDKKGSPAWKRERRR